MGEIASQITSLTIVYSTFYSDTDQRKHQSSASLAFVPGIHRGPVNSPHKGPVTRKMFPFDDVIMTNSTRMLTGTWRCLVLASPAFNMPCRFGPSLRSVESRRVLWLPNATNLAVKRYLKWTSKSVKSGSLGTKETILIIFIQSRRSCIHFIMRMVVICNGANEKDNGKVIQT